MASAFTRDECRLLKSRISMAICNLQHLNAFYSPATRRFYARCATRAPEDCYRAKKGAPPLPQDAIFIGIYSHPYAARDVLGDIEEALRSAPEIIPAPAPPVEEPAQVAAPKPLPELSLKWTPPRFNNRRAPAT